MHLVWFPQECGCDLGSGCAGASQTVTWLLQAANGLQLKYVGQKCGLVMRV